MATRMKIKFDKYWGNVEKQNLLLYVVVVLNPRYKLKFVTCCLKKLYSADEVKTLIMSVKSCFSKLVSHYSNELKLKNPEVSNNQSGSSIQEKVPMMDSDDDDSVNMFESDFDKECDEDDVFRHQK
ncbi:uncharacterized protein LOC133815344 [Humulus lupulus]|uniref:uncharacterized protein LOC133815344 n=1 Tax=Humulus lupulus TaxID=3486 RepID=UPI002B40970F|nr:uncharacterized protein LOC133815344 [Humulus lupulus]